VASSYFRLGFCASSQIYSMSIPCHSFNKAMCESPQIILKFTSFWLKGAAMMIMACQVPWIQCFSAKGNNFPSSQLTWHLDHTAVWACCWWVTNDYMGSSYEWLEQNCGAKMRYVDRRCLASLCHCNQWWWMNRSIRCNTIFSAPRAVRGTFVNARRPLA
jgi:hypothetical protein